MLGLTGYYHKFIPSYADLVQLLIKLTNKTVPFICTDWFKKAFRTLNDALMKSSIFVSSDPYKPYTLFMDASKYAWSTMLPQEHTTSIDGKTVAHQCPITYISGLFQGSQLNCTSLTKEAYTIYIALMKLSFCLADATITLQSDCLPLKWFLQKTTLNAKVNDLGIELCDCSIKLKFIKKVPKTHLLILCPG